MSSLEVDSVYFYPEDNSVQHHTDFYEVVHQESPTPVLRRGQIFYLAIRFKNRSYNKNEDIIKLLFNYGTQPAKRFGLPSTNVGIAVLHQNLVMNEKDVYNWFVKVQRTDEKTLTLEVRSPVTIPVGVWRLSVETSVLRSNRIPKIVYQVPEFIYFLFNPWNKDDAVYMPKKELLGEYVLNDVGKIWVGPINTTKGREWVFGQFDPIVLPAVMHVLDITQLPDEAKGDPIRLTRAISKLVNSNDDDGVLLGRWDGEYEDGTAPAAWTGSVPILEKFFESKTGVLYGQCWVFAGVTTTICRALGIPSRVVSNLVSGHDANESLTIDRYYTKDNEELESDPHNLYGVDSIWNYHVWNDVWMARPDLPKGYGGWQAIDATPQETSGGYYQCGPASLEAIKNGEVGLNYDTGFLVSSVNADIVRWIEDPESVLGYSRIECNKYHIGRMIITKEPFSYDPNGDSDRQNITDEYKPTEGTNSERLSLYNAIKETTRAKRFYDLPDAAQSDITFQLIDIDRINIGDNFSIIVKIKNTSGQARTIETALSASSVFYNGVKANLIKRNSGKFQLQPYSSEQLKLTIKPEEYVEKLVEYCIVKIYSIATVHETRQTWAGEDDFQVLTPNLNIIVPDEVFVNQPTIAKYQFKNPLQKTLTQCKLMFEGPGIVERTTINYGDLSPGAEFKVEGQLTPKKSGNKKLIAVFSSKELTDITGSANVLILD